MSRIKVITIGRQYCAGGSDIGKLTAQKLGIKCYDRELLDIAAEKSGISMKKILKYEESVLNPLLSPINLFGKENLSISEKIFAAETEVILDIVSKEDCIIVGRCADFILKNKIKTLDVFIYSTMEKRIETAVGQHGILPDEAENRLKKYDKKRSDFYNSNTNKKWGDMNGYDMCLNSAKLGYDWCAEIIAAAARESR